MISNWRQGVFTLLKKRKCLIIDYKSKVPWCGGCWRTEAQCLTDWLILPQCWPHSAGLYLVPGPWRTETKSQGADQRCLDSRPQQHCYWILNSHLVKHLYGGCSNVIVNICFDAILAVCWQMVLVLLTVSRICAAVFVDYGLFFVHYLSHCMP